MNRENNLRLFTPPATAVAGTERFDGPATSLAPAPAAVQTRPLCMVAIDGPSGSGKSTIAREIAQRLRVGYLDTGASYRCVTLAVLEAGIPTGDAVGIAGLARTLIEQDALGISTDPAQRTVRLLGRDVSAPIRGAGVTTAVSAVSAVPEVRRLLVRWQRGRASEPDGGCVVEGRDIGTVVLPEAPVKVWLTASASVRAARRAAEVGAGNQEPAERVRVALDRRDALDAGRQHDPAAPAADAVVLDSSALGIDSVVSAVLELCTSAGWALPPERPHADDPVGR